MPQIINEVKADLMHVGIPNPEIEVCCFDDVLQFEAAVPTYLLKLHGSSSRRRSAVPSGATSPSRRGSVSVSVVSDL